MTSPHSLVLRWREETNPKIVWFLRGINPDGSYYGEIRSQFNIPRSTDGVHGIIRTVEGHLTNHDVETIFTHATIIRNRNHTVDAADSRGVLADGPMNKSTLLIRFRDTDPDTEVSRAFLDIIRILRPYFEPLYLTLSQDATLKS